MVTLNEVKDGDLGLAPGEELLDDVPSDEAATADDKAGGEGGEPRSAPGLACRRKETEANVLGLGACFGSGHGERGGKGARAREGRARAVMGVARCAAGAGRR